MLENLINEEAILFAKYRRNEVKGWEPRSIPAPFLSSSPDIFAAISAAL